jgi:DNA (cytosine-5)-methyltransferase 1
VKHGSLFSGIGGFDLAAEWAGWTNVFHCEINPFGQKVLKHYWPESISYADIKQTDFTIHRGGIDILSGGFPCQPYSTAGKRKGKEDDRHLWPQMLRAVREISPRWILGENVRGLTNWSGGLVFDEVQADLEAEGYEVLPFLLPACAVNAPHRRDRIWFVAKSTNVSCNGKLSGNRRDTQSLSEIRPDEPCVFTNTGGQFMERWKEGRQPAGRSQSVNEQLAGCDQLHGQNWQDFPTESPVCGRNDGLSSELDGITFPNWRNESIKGYGNAVVPVLVLEIFKAINEYESQWGKASEEKLSA